MRAVSLNVLRPAAAQTLKMEGEATYDVAHRIISLYACTCPDVIKGECGTVVFVFSEDGNMFSDKIPHACESVKPRNRIIRVTPRAAKSVRVGKEHSQTGAHIRLKRAERILPVSIRIAV